MHVFFGIETATQLSLDLMRKGFTVEQALEACLQVKKAGMRVIESFIVGLPGETPSSVQGILDFVGATKPDRVLLNMLTVYPGTLIAADSEAFDIVSYSRDWSRAEQSTAMVVTRQMNGERIREAYVRLVFGLEQMEKDVAAPQRGVV